MRSVEPHRAVQHTTVRVHVHTCVDENRDVNFLQSDHLVV